jgi:hypothetical protein
MINYLMQNWLQTELERLGEYVVGRVQQGYWALVVQGSPSSTFVKQRNQPLRHAFG